MSKVKSTPETVLHQVEQVSKALASIPGPISTCLLSNFVSGLKFCQKLGNDIDCSSKRKNTKEQPIITHQMIRECKRSTHKPYTKMQ